MGCDIHLYIEYAERNEARKTARSTLTAAEIEELRTARFSTDPEAARRVARLIDEVTERRASEKGVELVDDQHWRPFGGEFRPERIYSIFGRLAGVRDEDAPHIAPRGLPKKLGYKAEADAFLYVREGDCDGDCDRSCTKEDVKKWNSTYKDGTTDYVWHPDHHSHSWLTFDEFSAVLGEESDVSYDAVRAAMQAYEDDGYDTRVVFWFDN